VLSCLQLAAGVALGWFLARLFQGSAVNARGRHLQRSARRLGRLVQRVAGDVGEHQARIDEVSRQLDECRSPEGSLLAEVVLGAISQVVEGNSHLRERLAQTEKKLERQADEIQRQIKEARTDPLTELPNRRAFRDELDRLVALAARNRSPFSLIVLDLDHFKGLNDRYGHGVGDHVLRATGQVIRSALRPNDLAARIGGEEFAVLLPGAKADEARRVGERLRAALAAETFHLDNRPVQTTVSLGIAQAGPQEHALGVLKRADEALYAAKHAGRNRSFFHDGRQPTPIAASAADRAPQGGNGAPRAIPPSGDAAAHAAALPTAENPEPDDEFRQLCRQLRERLETVVAG
jgi:diguanylate cyclase